MPIHISIMLVQHLLFRGRKGTTAAESVHLAIEWLRLTFDTYVIVRGFISEAVLDFGLTITLHDIDNNCRNQPCVASLSYK